MGQEESKPSQSEDSENSLSREPSIEPEHRRSSKRRTLRTIFAYRRGFESLRRHSSRGDGKKDRSRLSALFSRRRRSKEETSDSNQTVSGGLDDQSVRQFRELISTWPLSDVEEIVQLYAELGRVQQLQAECDRARPECKTVGDDLLELLEETFLPEKNTLTDLTVSVDDEQFVCHKAVLAARSYHFRRLLVGDGEKSEAVSAIQLPMLANPGGKSGGIGAETFRMLLRFLYSGKLPHGLSKSRLGWGGRLVVATGVGESEE